MLRKGAPGGAGASPRRFAPVAGGLAALLLLPLGCSVRAPSTALVVGVASSVAGVVESLVEQWAAAGGDPVRITSGSSSTLARQIERGAPVDVLISADRAWVDLLTEAGLARLESVCTVAENRLVLYRRAEGGPEGSAAFEGAGPIAAGLQLGPAMVGPRWTTGDPGHVPLGRYAKEALVSLGWWESLSPTLIPAANARAAVRLMELGQVDFGIGYSTDVAGPEWSVRPLASGLTGAIEVTAVQMSDCHAGAASFMAFLQGPAASDGLRAAGFVVGTADSRGDSER